MLSFFRRLSKSAVGTGFMVLVLLMILAGFAHAGHPQRLFGQFRDEQGNAGQDRQTNRSPSATSTAP